LIDTMTKKENDVATQDQSLVCGCAAASPEKRPSRKGVLDIVAVMAAALFLMYAEIWANDQAPLWSSACVLRPANAMNNDANGDTSSPFRDTAGPVAVLH
jgi:hypothetical protein